MSYRLLKTWYKVQQIIANTNVDKCRSVSYGRRLEFLNTYTISDNVIAKVDKEKDLGVTFDSRLKFDECIDIKISRP